MLHLNPPLLEQLVLLTLVGSQGGAVGYSPDFHSGGLGLTPAWGNQQTNIIKTT